MNDDYKLEKGQESINGKMLSPLDGIAAEEVVIALKKRKIIFKIVFMFIWLLFCVAFYYISRTQEEKILSGFFIIVGISVLFHLFSLSKEVTLQESNPAASAIVMNKDGIFIPRQAIDSFIPNPFEAQNGILFLDWSVINNWIVDWDIGDGPDYHILELKNSGKIKILSYVISDEKAMLDYVRKAGKISVCLKRNL